MNELCDHTPGRDDLWLFPRIFFRLVFNLIVVVIVFSPLLWFFFDRSLEKLFTASIPISFAIIVLPAKEELIRWWLFITTPFSEEKFYIQNSINEKRWSGWASDNVVAGYYNFDLRKHGMQLPFVSRLLRWGILERDATNSKRVGLTKRGYSYQAFLAWMGYKMPTDNDPGLEEPRFYVMIEEEPK